jgi:phosphodiesterase/alkaline phosphatase D-like protein
VRRMQVFSVVLLAFFLLGAGGQALASEPEITNSGENLRTGWYPEASSITPQLVTGGTFGQLWSTPVEGQVYAQPLLADGTLFVATEDDKVYGLNPTTGAVKWSKSLGEPWQSADIGCGDLAPSIGVTATPVIDPSTGIAYLTHKTYVSGKSGESRWYMDAISVTTGEEQPGFPVEIAGTAQNEPAQRFQPERELQRPGLLLLEGVVYAGFGSDCDDDPYQGWVFGVSTSGVVKARWTSETDGSGSGIWQSGAGIMSDGPGTMMVSTGNGGTPEPPTLGSEAPGNLGESIVRLRVQTNGSLKATDFFAPFNAAELSSWDADFASGGVTGLPDEYFGTRAIPSLAVAVGKDGYVYLLNRENLGGIGEGPGGTDDVVQQIGPYGGVWSRPGVWPGEGGWVYIPTASAGTSAAGSSGNLDVYQYGVSGTGSPTLSLQGSSKEAFGFSSSAPVITSEGTTPGSALVWIVWAPNGTGEGAQLRAYAPKPVGGEPVLLWKAPIGTSAKFALPGVGAGRLYVGTRDGHVLAFGSPVTPVLTGPDTVFPTTTMGDSSHATAKLTATEPLTVTKLSSSSTEFELGTPSIALPATLTTGQTLELPVTFSPKSSGPLAATLTATTSTDKTATFSLSGTGLAPTAQLEASPPVVTFGATSVGESVSAGATFRNVGGAPLKIEAVHLPAAPFGATGVPTVGSTLEPGQSVTITVTFNPTAVGDFNDELALETSGGDEAVRLSGSAGLPGALSINSETNEFGLVPVGSNAVRTFTITNTGGTTVLVTKSKPPNGGAFAAITSLPEGTTIAPGEQLTEQVAFVPTAVGPTEGVWVINGTGTSGLREVRFSGIGTAAPAVETGMASLIAQTSATLNATVSPDGDVVSSCHFEYGKTMSYGSSVPCTTLPGSGTTPVGVSALIAALDDNTTYYFRIVAANALGTSYGSARSLTTKAAAPAVETGVASSVGQTTATLNATVNPNSETVSDCHFEYGETSSYGSVVPCSVPPGSGSAVVGVSAVLEALAPGTVFYYRIVATNHTGTSFGNAANLSTQPAAPALETGVASSVTQTSATLNATVNPNGETVSACRFEYGTTSMYGSSAPCAASPGSGSSAVSVSAPVEGLTAATTYDYRIAATNSLGTSYGAAASFATSAAPPPLGPGLSEVLPSLESLAPPLPDVVLGSLTLTAQPPGTITVRVACPEDVANCAGTLTLRTLAAVATSTHGHSKKSILTLASGSFAIAGGRATRVKLHLSAKARALLARVHRLRAVVTIVAHDNAGTSDAIHKDVTVRLLASRRRP